ncbi:MAG: polysaccharide biosynthesis/export family protein, partial [Burkholderiales bacterium]|nr:polysaccharide biosynthesis/export family protein [Burkholderiales bacterium]
MSAPTAVPAAAPAQPETQTQAQPQAPGFVDINERNQFQDFVAQSTGLVLPLFGYNLFQGAPSTFAPVDRIPVTSDYVIGPGDSIVIQAWGQIDVQYTAVVDRNGQINIPKVGTLSVAGLRFQDLHGFLKTAIGRNFRNFELNVTMGELRSIQVFVVGQAARPGEYTVSSLSTLVNALFASGGPSAKGSMRRIQLKRGTQIVAEFDMYDLLVNGDKSKDARLLPGDVIYIPPVGQLAALSGSV